MSEKADTMKNEKGAFSRLLSCVTWVFLAFVVYVLSAGPAFKVAIAHQSTWMPVVDKLYAPVGWVCYRSHRAERLLDWYLLKIWHVSSSEDAR
jgi:hypothetical protein